MGFLYAWKMGLYYVCNIENNLLLFSHINDDNVTQRPRKAFFDYNLGY